MPKVKTKKSLKKRVEVTGSGKLRRMQASKRHLLSGKTSKRKRRLSRPAIVSNADSGNMRKMLPYDA